MSDDKIPNNNEKDLCDLLTKIDGQLEYSAREELKKSLGLLDVMMMRQGIEDNKLLKRKINDLKNMIGKHLQDFTYRVHWENEILTWIHSVKADLGCIQK